MSSCSTAVVLAAGRGTRMGALTAHTPKPLLPLQGRPILEHILAGLKAAGIRRAVVVTGYLGEQIERSLGDGARLGMDLSYRRQTIASGTATALLLARDALDDEPFVLCWGDILVEAAEYARLVAAFAARPCAALLALNAVDDPWRGAAVYVDDTGVVTRIVEKPPRGTSTTCWNNAGIFVLTAAVLAYAERLPASERGEFELPQALAAMVDAGESVRGLALRGFWSDLGTPEDLAAAEESYPGAAAPS